MQATLERLKARREERRDEGGFTLIELLIVIVILAILAAIVVFAVQNLSGTSAQASCNSDYKTVQTATEAYKAQMGQYPIGTNPVTVAGTVSSGTATDQDLPGTFAASVLTGTNAAANNGELMTGSEVLATANDANGNATKNLDSPSGTSVGPWLRTLPLNGKHYAIAVSNDGTGTIVVDTVNAAGTAATGNPVPAANGAALGTCGAVS
jgi:general secretion pathway protein G